MKEAKCSGWPGTCVGTEGTMATDMSVTRMGMVHRKGSPFGKFGKRVRSGAFVTLRQVTGLRPRGEASSHQQVNQRPEGPALLPFQAAANEPTTQKTLRT